MSGRRSSAGSCQNDLQYCFSLIPNLRRIRAEPLSASKFEGMTPSRCTEHFLQRGKVLLQRHSVSSCWRSLSTCFPLHSCQESSTKRTTAPRTQRVVKSVHCGRLRSDDTALFSSFTTITQTCVPFLFPPRAGPITRAVQYAYRTSSNRNERQCG